MQVAFYLKRPNSETSTSIFARISYYGLQAKWYIPDSIEPRYWNIKTRKARETRNFPNYLEFNQKLLTIETEIQNIIRRYMNDHKGQLPSVPVLKTVLDKELRFKQEKTLDFFGFYQKLIDDAAAGLRLNYKTGKPIKAGTDKVYTTVFNHLKDFQAKKNYKIDFDSIDLDFYDKYKEFLTKDIKLALNTIGKHFQTIKLVMNEATEKGINTNLKYKSRRFITLREDADDIYLNEADLKLVANAELNNRATLERVRDLFLIGCYTGLRFSDFSTLKMENIKNGFITIKQSKTSEPVAIPLHDKVKEILKKYNNELPPSYANQKMNGYLKNIGQLIPQFAKTIPVTITKGGETKTEHTPKWKQITTHTARRSFATNEYLAGTPTLLIMKITGHKTEKAFLRYIKITSTEHAQRLAELWKTRETAK